MSDYPSDRCVVVKLIAAIRQWAESEDEVVFPEAGSRPVPHLPVLPDGIKCTASDNGKMCGYIRRGLKHIQEHCREEHRWENSRIRGRPRNGPQELPSTMWMEGVHCQKFQGAGRLGRLFERSLEMVFTQATEALERANRKAIDEIRADTNRFEVHKWLNRVGWARHLKGLDRGKKEKALDKVCFAAETVMWKAQQASRSSVVRIAAMNYINRREMGSETNEKPFNARQTGKTMERYSSRWLEVIRYILRTHRLDVVSQKDQGRTDGDEG
ncbi:hypothetical protein K469DRAFT_813099 [Zopfia rhizophila CBS 207.26]|uniref:C2H2-type domain-containing protein n=1 Tax=Zopfia rhizophila CBS 207.26 TaxID=1314779 RepID=A0A6A6DDF3_9PEZI|nr:hypothetical protein K469DRAFT_813099 [Zopfia rhizophila CBS 207.26]